MDSHPHDQPLVPGISQYAYFGIFSEILTADDVAERLGLQPDQVDIRSSRVSNPRRPRYHAWMIRCDEPGLRVEQLVEELVARLRPIEDELAAICTDTHIDDGSGCVLQVVRYLADENELTHKAKRSDLLGYIIPAETLAFLARIRAPLAFDEYDA